jgi:hypothetical protein
MPLQEQPIFACLTRIFFKSRRRATAKPKALLWLIQNIDFLEILCKLDHGSAPRFLKIWIHGAAARAVFSPPGRNCPAKRVRSPGGLKFNQNKAAGYKTLNFGKHLA